MPENWTVGAISRAMLPVLLPLTVVEVGSGLVLGTFEADLYAHPSLLVLVPVTIGMAGNLGSILASRLSTAFHLGTLSFDPRDDDLAGNALATMALALTLFPLAGVGAWAIKAVTGTTDLGVVTVVLVSLTSGAALALLAIAVTLVSTYAAYHLELDPDDVVIPVVTNTCDVLGVVILYAVVQVLVP
ncbi:magnesium transporter [Halospeciosus flavus]|uniref:Magnesium transporter n=1 Tax=Halospeciosus flavus TaxID=3032283 RepID=A0ABD5Z7E0_9EURY|nr:magnesium transporter [Halospeciosus flavus]